MNSAMISHNYANHIGFSMMLAMMKFPPGSRPSLAKPPIYITKEVPILKDYVSSVMCYKEHSHLNK